MFVLFFLSSLKQKRTIPLWLIHQQLLEVSKLVALMKTAHRQVVCSQSRPGQGLHRSAVETNWAKLELCTRHSPRQALLDLHQFDSWYWDALQERHHCNCEVWLQLYLKIDDSDELFIRFFITLVRAEVFFSVVSPSARLLGLGLENSLIV